MKRLLCLLALVAFAATAMGCPPYRHHGPPGPQPGGRPPHTNPFPGPGPHSEATPPPVHP